MTRCEVLVSRDGETCRAPAVGIAANTVKFNPVRFAVCARHAKACQPAFWTIEPLPEEAA